MKVALVQCPGWDRECPPFSLACLAAYVRQHNHDAVCFDINNALYHAAPETRLMWDDKDSHSFWENPSHISQLISKNEEIIDQFVTNILNSGAHVIGFTTHTASYLFSLQIAIKIKQRSPERLVLFGGPQCSREQAALRFAGESAVDAVIVGEGEETLHQVLNHLEKGRGLEPLPGLILRWQGEIKDCGGRELLPDLNLLPFPDYSDFEQEIIQGRYANPKRLEILGSRGCVRTCHFCSEWHNWQRFRSMSAERMFEEIRTQMQKYPQVSHFYFIDSLLNGNIKALERFCDLVLESGIKFTWAGQAIVHPLMDDSILNKMARAGCVWLGYGIETGSETLRERINEKFTNENAYRTLKATQEAGIKAQINIMFGLPTETREEFNETMKFLKEARPYINSVRASQSFCVVDKNTIYYNEPDKFGITGQEHHLFWESNSGENNFPERFRRYEEFCTLALSMGVQESSGVVRRKPDKYYLLGQYFQYKGQPIRAILYFRRSLHRESVNKATLLALAQSYRDFGKNQKKAHTKARAYLEAALHLIPEGMTDTFDEQLRQELDDRISISNYVRDGWVYTIRNQRWARDIIAPYVHQETSREVNVILNEKEYKQGSETLLSTPRFVTLGTHNACNAKCTFCLEGNYSRFNLQLYKDFFEAKMGHFIRNAESVTFTGFGEILFIPGIEEFLDYINETLPHTRKVFTTNGTPLTPSVIQRLLKGYYTIQISLHASYSSLHEKTTLLKDQFDQVISNIRNLTTARDRLNITKKLHVQLINVLTADNIHDLPDFIRLGWSLGAQQIRCFYMTMFSQDHIRLSCFFDQERANKMVSEAMSVVREFKADELRHHKYQFQVDLPPLFGETVSNKKMVCPDPWHYFYAELDGATEPCCFWGEHSGNLKKGDEVDLLWNNPFYQDLRKGMSSGDPHPWCKKCIKYNGYNVNDILCHITARPGQQKVILEEITRLKNLPDLRVIEKTVPPNALEEILALRSEQM